MTIRHPYIYVGKISSKITQEAKDQSGIRMQSASIYVSENQLKHILKGHEEELSEMGLSVIDYIKFVCKNFNQIRSAQGYSVLLVVYNATLPHTAVVDLNYAFNRQKGFWEIKTAEPRRRSTVINKALIWEAAKHTSNGRDTIPIRHLPGRASSRKADHR